MDKETYQKLVKECQKEKGRDKCEGCPDFWAEECVKGIYAIERWAEDWDD